MASVRAAVSRGPDEPAEERAWSSARCSRRSTSPSGGLGGTCPDSTGKNGDPGARPQHADIEKIINLMMPLP